MARCEKCGAEGGRPYPLLYGSLSSAWTGAGTRTNMQVTGVQDVLICDRCALKTYQSTSRGLEWIIGIAAVVLAGGLGWAGWPALWAPLVAAGVVGLGVVAVVMAGRQARDTSPADQLRDGGEGAASSISRKVLPHGTTGWSPGEWVLQQQLGTGDRDHKKLEAEVRALMVSLPHQNSASGQST